MKKSALVVITALLSMLLYATPSLAQEAEHEEHGSTPAREAHEEEHGETAEHEEHGESEGHGGRPHHANDFAIFLGATDEHGHDTELTWGLDYRRMVADRWAVGGLFDYAGGDLRNAILAATGSELHLALEIRRNLAADGKRLNVVSIPCLELFESQDPVYKGRLFPTGVPVATIEAGLTAPWRSLAGPDGLTIGVDRFGASAPAAVLAEKYGLTVDSAGDRITAWLG